MPHPLDAMLARLLAGSALLACGSAWAALPAGPYRLDDISGGGVLPYAVSINNAGAVVGRTDNWFAGYHWSPESGLLRIADPVLPDHVPDPVRGSASPADINASGTVVGSWAPRAEVRGFSYTVAGGSRDLGLEGLRAHDITDSGRILGSVWQGGVQSFLVIEPDGALTELAPPVALHGAVGLRTDGSVVANRDLGSFRAAAGWIDATQAWHELPSIGQYRSEAGAFNERGAIVGNMAFQDEPTGALVEHAFAYTPEAGLVDLTATLPFADSLYSRATAVNDSGLVVGYGSRGPERQVYGFIHDLSSGRFIDLDKVLLPGTADGWSNLIFSDVNDLGQIAGWGWYGTPDEGQVRAFVLTPTAPPVPEPGTVPMLLAGVALVAWSARLRRH